MPFVKGEVTNPEGAWKIKPFRDALKREIAAAGPDHRKLRRIARKLLQEAENGNMAAITEVANRLDGKPAQEATITVDHKSGALDWTRDELVAWLRDRGTGSPGVIEANRRDQLPDSVHGVHVLEVQDIEPS